jgi:hypothetical protein
MSSLETNSDLLRQRIVHFLCFVGVAKGTSIENKVVGKTRKIYSVLNQMVEDGEIERTGSGGKKDPFQYSLKQVECAKPIAEIKRDQSERISLTL